MTKNEASRPLELIGIKVPAEMLAEIRRQAREDDRTVSGYLRRLIAAALPKSQVSERDER